MPTYEYSAFLQVAGETEHAARARLDELQDIAGTTMGITVGIDESEPVELDDEDDDAGDADDPNDPESDAYKARTAMLYRQDARP